MRVAASAQRRAAGRKWLEVCAGRKHDKLCVANPVVCTTGGVVSYGHAAPAMAEEGTEIVKVSESLFSSNGADEMGSVC